ncbi:MAG: hypothetical protein NTX95_03515 [Actinobacteria bacterium]|nr:hypothetical protein [Actinomycetota bacterium]
MKHYRTRIIGSVAAGTGAAALVIAGMAFGMPNFNEERDPALTESARARQELRQRDVASTSTSPWGSSDASRTKAGEQILPAQAAPAPAADAAIAAAPAVVPAAAEEPTSAPSPVYAGEYDEDDDESAGHAEYEGGDDYGDDEGGEDD